MLILNIPNKIKKAFNIFRKLYLTRNQKAFIKYLKEKGIKIGNNIYFGTNVIILKGVTIGDNCIIAAGSIITKDIPANSVAAGIPAKVICSLSNYYKKREKACITEAFEYARSIVERFNRKPTIEDFHEEFVLFTDGHKKTSHKP